MHRTAPHNTAGLASLFLPATCERLRSETLGAHLDGFIEALHQAGYCSLTAKQYVGPVIHFGVWLDRRGICLDEINAKVVAAFDAHLGKCQCRRRSRVRRCGNSRVVIWVIRLFVRHLRERGVVRAEPRPGPPKIVDEFELWMREHRGTADRTLADYRRFVIAFVVSRRGRRWRRLDAKTMRAYVVEQSGRQFKSQMLVLVRALRMFIRFLVATGRCPAHVDRSVPSVPAWKLATLPRYLAAEDVERILAAHSSVTPIGLRDRAVLLLLARLGLRGDDVRKLCLADLDWVRGWFRVVGKLRRPAWLPLPQEAGDALLAYLRVRPICAIPEVFLCAKAPYRSLAANSVSHICRRAIDTAGVTSPTRGAHVFRHSAATTLIRHGATLDDVGRLLRHASAESTAIYAKVAVASLQRIAQPWPGVAP